jgi:hypothetical protein
MLLVISGAIEVQCSRLVILHTLRECGHFRSAAEAE